MRRAAVCAALALLIAVQPLQAQVSEHAVELFGTGGLIGGLTPVRVGGTSYLTPHGGVSLDGGVQGEQLAFGVGLRYWEAVRTHQVGTSGGDLFALGEWRAHRDSRTTVRVTAGVGFASLDDPGGSALISQDTNNDVTTVSLGVAREFFVPTGARLLLSADIIVPPAGGADNGRRRPVVELGVGYRSRFLQSIGVIPSGPRR